MKDDDFKSVKQGSSDKEKSACSLPKIVESKTVGNIAQKDDFNLLILAKIKIFSVANARR